MRSRFHAAVVAAVLATPVLGQDAGEATPDSVVHAFPTKPTYSPYVDRDFPTRPFFGDTHLHTAASFDAGAFGARLTPRDAYRFARGEQVMASSGQPAKLSRPLDFLVVSDHSDNMGFFPDLLAGKTELLADPTGRRWYDMIHGGKGNDAAMEIIVAFSQGTLPKDLIYSPGSRAYHSAWQETIAAAEAYNEPGRFTAFIGYEWTSNTGGNNLHRNVIFRDNADKASRVEPYTTMKPLGSDNPRDLWKWMSDYEQKTGGNVLAIAHNGNLSNGRMFPIIESFTGKRVDKPYVEQRARWERLYEVTQTKGTGESHPSLSPTDEFANFEIWDKGNLDGSEAKKPEMLEFEYARSGLKNGLASRAPARHEPVQVRARRQHGCAYGALCDRRGQLLRQDHPAGAESGAADCDIRKQCKDRREDHGLGGRLVGLSGRLGQRQHTRVALGRDGTPGDLRNDRHAARRPLLRQLRFRRGRCAVAQSGFGRLWQGRADGW